MAVGLGDAQVRGEGDGRIRIAGAVVGARSRRSGYQRLLARGEIYLVETAAIVGRAKQTIDAAKLGTQHLALRCPAQAGAPAKGAFVDLSPEGMADVTDPALRSMLQRLAEETRMGNYGTYFGTHEQGRVQPIAEGQN